MAGKYKKMRKAGTNPHEKHISFSEEELPEIKDWKVGGRYRIVLEVEQRELRKGSDFFDDGGEEKHARFRVHSVAAAEDEDFESEFARKHDRAIDKKA